MLTKEEKIEVLTECILTLKNEVERLDLGEEDSPTIAKAQQWLSELDNEGWISVNEKLPPVGEFVCVANKHGVCATSHQLTKYGDWMEYGSSCAIKNITHWQPINPPVK